MIAFDCLYTRHDGRSSGAKNNMHAAIRADNIAHLADLQGIGSLLEGLLHLVLLTAAISMASNKRSHLTDAPFQRNQDHRPSHGMSNPSAPSLARRTSRGSH